MEISNTGVFEDAKLVSTWCLTSTKTIRLIRDGENGSERGYGGGGRSVRVCVCVCVGGGVIYKSLHCHHQNDSCIKTGSDESDFNVSLSVRDKVTRPCPQTTAFLKRKESLSGYKPRSFCYQSNALPLGQTGGVYVPCIYTIAR